MAGNEDQLDHLELEKALQDAKTEIQKLTQENGCLLKDIKKLNHDHIALREVSENQKLKITQLNKQVEDCKTCKILKDILTEKEVKYKDLNLKYVNKTEELREKEDQLQKSEEHRHNLQGTLKHVSAANETWKKKSQEWEEEIFQMSSQIGAYKKECDTLKSALKQEKETVTSLLLELTGVTEKNKMLINEIDGLDIKVDQLLKQRDTYVSEMEKILQSQQEKYRSARQILLHKVKQYEVQLSSNNKDHISAAAAILDAPINPGKRLGGGCFGAVYEAKVNGATCVAKRLLDILTGARGHEQVSKEQWGVLADKFKVECSLLSKLRHPNVVQFLGVYEPSDDPRDMALVMEKLYMDLENFITKYPHMSLPIKLHILRDISCGLLHIHSHDIVHRDLNAGNVLLTHNLQAKVADLGASRVLGRNFSGKLTAVPGAQDYMPPEAINDDPQYDFQLDVFSFGHLSLYLAICEFPKPREISSDEISQMTLFGKVVGIQAKKRMKWLEKMGRNHCLLDLIVQCLEYKPEQRPSMYKVNQEIEHCFNQLQIEVQVCKKDNIADKHLQLLEKCKMLQLQIELSLYQESKKVGENQPNDQELQPDNLGSDYSVTDVPILTVEELRQRLMCQWQYQGDGGQPSHSDPSSDTPQASGDEQLLTDTVDCNDHYFQPE